MSSQKSLGRGVELGVRGQSRRRVRAHAAVMTLGAGSADCDRNRGDQGGRDRGSAQTGQHLYEQATRREDAVLHAKSLTGRHEAAPSMRA